MPIPTRLISLNLGSQTIGLAEFRMQPHGGLVLVDYRLRQIPADLTNEEARHSQITAALREMMDELRIKHGRVNYAIAAQSALPRWACTMLLDITTATSPVVLCSWISARGRPTCSLSNPESSFRAAFQLAATRSRPRSPRN